MLAANIRPQQKKKKKKKKKKVKKHSKVMEGYLTVLTRLRHYVITDKSVCCTSILYARIFDFDFSTTFSYFSIIYESL